MKTILLFVLSLLFSLNTFAQKNVTKFLGIPVDGTKSEMIRKIKEKGFRSSPFDPEILQGEFNGRDVTVVVVTNNDKVYRVFVTDQNSEDERSIQIRFNKLYSQFAQNLKYIPAYSEDQRIPDDEDISYEMSVNNKRYEAAFFQDPNFDQKTKTRTDSVEVRNYIQKKLLEKYTEEQINNPTEEEKEQMTFEMFKSAYEYTIELSSNNQVWFMINEEYGKYKILLFYDNMNNQANGEDL